MLPISEMLVPILYQLQPSKYAKLPKSIIFFFIKPKSIPVQEYLMPIYGQKTLFTFCFVLVQLHSLAIRLCLLAFTCNQAIFNCIHMRSPAIIFVICNHLHSLLFTIVHINQAEVIRHTSCSWLIKIAWLFHVEVSCKCLQPFSRSMVCYKYYHLPWRVSHKLDHIMCTIVEKFSWPKCSVPNMTQHAQHSQKWLSRILKFHEVKRPATDMDKSLELVNEIILIQDFE